jgi:hypothetical protein
LQIVAHQSLFACYQQLAKNTFHPNVCAKLHTCAS